MAEQYLPTLCVRTGMQLQHAGCNLTIRRAKPNRNKPEEAVLGLPTYLDGSAFEEVDSTAKGGGLVLARAQQRSSGARAPGQWEGRAMVRPTSWVFVFSLG